MLISREASCHGVRPEEGISLHSSSSLHLRCSVNIATRLPIAVWPRTCSYSGVAVQLVFLGWFVTVWSVAKAEFPCRPISVRPSIVVEVRDLSLGDWKSVASYIAL